MSDATSFETSDAEAGAAALARGVGRTFAHLGFATLTEFTLRSGRRADVIALDPKGGLTIVEIKTSVADYRSDNKWQDYLEFCDRFYFAVPELFPCHLIPERCGLMIADAYAAEVMREPEAHTLNAARRRHILLRFAHVAGSRLRLLTDPLSHG